MTRLRRIGGRLLALVGAERVAALSALAILTVGVLTLTLVAFQQADIIDRQRATIAELEATEDEVLDAIDRLQQNSDLRFDALYDACVDRD